MSPPAGELEECSFSRWLRNTLKLNRLETSLKASALKSRTTQHYWKIPVSPSVAGFKSIKHWKAIFIQSKFLNVSSVVDSNPPVERPNPQPSSPRHCRDIPLQVGGAGSQEAVGRCLWCRHSWLLPPLEQWAPRSDDQSAVPSSGDEHILVGPSQWRIGSEEKQAMKIMLILHE